MREKPRDKERLNHMIEAIDNIFELPKENVLTHTEAIKWCDLQSLKILKLSVKPPIY